MLSVRLPVYSRLLVIRFSSIWIFYCIEGLAPLPPVLFKGRLCTITMNLSCFLLLFEHVTRSVQITRVARVWFLLNGTGVGHLPTPFVLHIKKLRAHRKAICSWVQQLVNSRASERRSDGRGQCLPHRAVTPEVEGKTMLGERIPSPLPL